MTQLRTAFYSGSFDPITNGHMDVLRSALIAFDRVVVGIGVHAAKKGLFAFDERKALIEECLAESGLESSRVSIVSFDKLAVDAAQQAEAQVIVRGLRDTDDFAFEMQMAGMNSAMRPELPTIFMPASAATRPISATLVKQIAAMGGDVSPFVPAPVAKALASAQ